MFSHYVRTFVAAGIILIAIAAVFVGSLYRSLVGDDVIKRHAERNNVSLAQGFVNTVWKERGNEVTHSSGLSPEERADVLKRFVADSAQYFNAIPVVKLNIYSADGSKVLAIEAGVPAGENEDLLAGKVDRSKIDKALSSTAPMSEVITEAEYRARNGSRKQGVLVRTLIPIFAKDSVSEVVGSSAKAEAVMEIFYDVTDSWAGILSSQYIITGVILALFVLFYIFLNLASRRAEKTIEDQHDANLEMAAAKARAEAASQEKSQFLANISHELRTPLNAIIGFSEIIKDEVMGPLENAQYKNYIKDIYSSGVHLLSLINDILDYSKAEAGKLVLEFEEVDMNKVIKNSIRLVTPRAENAGVTLREELPTEHVVIRTDAKRIRQVLLNLLSNAVKFTPSGGSVTVAMWDDVVEKVLVLEVRDTGIGIAQKDIAKAMAPFGQVDSELSRKYEGTGLGLPLTKKFVELMGGKFNIESQLKVGTKVTFSLPKLDVFSNNPHGQQSSSNHKF